MVSSVSGDQVENDSDARPQGGLSAPSLVAGEVQSAHVVPHESPVSSAHSAPREPQFRSEKSALRLSGKLTLWRRYQALKEQGLSQSAAAIKLGISNASLSRMESAVRANDGDLEAAFGDRYANCGRTPRLRLTAEEQQELRSIYLATERNAEEGSMRHACRVFALRDTTREEIRTVFLSALERGVLPPFAVKILRQVTTAHFAARRKPGMLNANHFGGFVGAFADDKIQRRRVVESDDGTLNIVGWIPWPHGGDPISDKYGVRLGRWQFLPAIEAGWSQYYLGYSLIARHRGSYRTEDVLNVIRMVCEGHGLPDKFRFERGTWESNRVLELLKGVGVELDTVYQSNHKPYIESGFSKLWTYLSTMPGNVGRFRGAFEEENLQVERCRAGRQDPRELFPSYKEIVANLDAALTLANTTRINSKTYGSWIPEVRYREHKQERAWSPLPQSVKYLFSPIVTEWTVRKGAVSGKVKLTEDISIPVCFRHDELWRSEGQLVRCYFDIAADPCVATIVATKQHLCYSPGDVIGEATLLGEIPHLVRAALGWADPSASSAKPPSQRGPLSAVRRETRALAPGGQIISATSEERDGRGSNNRIERTAAKAEPVERGSRRATSPQPEDIIDIDPPLTEPRASASGFRSPQPEEEIEHLTFTRKPQAEEEVEIL